MKALKSTLACLAVSVTLNIVSLILWRSQKSDLDNALTKLASTREELDSLGRKNSSLTKHLAELGHSILAGGSDSRSSAALAEQRRAARYRALALLQQRKLFQLKLDYKPFFDKLDPAKASKLLALMKTENVDIFKSLMDAEMAGEDLSQREQLAATIKQQANSEIASLLTPDELQAFQDYTHVLPDVKEAENIKNVMYSENLPLTTDQVNAITQALIATPKPTTLASLTQGQVSREQYNQSWTGYVQQVNTVVAPTLSNAQQQLFTDYQSRLTAQYMKSTDLVMKAIGQ